MLRLRKNLQKTNTDSLIFKKKKKLAFLIQYNEHQAERLVLD